MSSTFTVTLADNGLLERVVPTDGKGTVAEIPVLYPFPPGKTTAASAIGIVVTEENPVCWYWIQGGRALKVCR